MHRWDTLVEGLRPHQLDAGHDLLLMAHQRHPEPLDVSLLHANDVTQSVVAPCSEVVLVASHLYGVQPLVD